MDIKKELTKTLNEHGFEVIGFTSNLRSSTLQIEISTKKLNEGIFSSDNGDFCPKCESSKVAHDHEYYYCTNKGCCHVWAKSQERSV